MKSDLHCKRKTAEGRQGKEGEEGARDPLCKVSIAQERDKPVKKLGCKWNKGKGAEKGYEEEEG